MAAFEIQHILPNSLLMKVDKMTMAHGLEARVPFLDHNFVLRAARLNYKKKISAFSTKISLRSHMHKRLPETILGRSKHGFILPIGKWLNRELRGFAYDTLLSSQAEVSRIFPSYRIAGLFRKRKGLSAIESSSLLWKLLIFELWYKIYFKKDG